ncbi:SWIM zinc finger family protein [Nocardioides sp. C4-1]|uniref:SWIM zinc finger family protein n=1 Tax=Nocardioides sp. C4-1 TaxID=3151851 RepID=UPI00326735A0
MTRWSLAAVERAAPDASSWTAARKLATPGPWSQTGATDALVWGRCQGSGRTPYQVSVDLDGPAYRCSCPSRKFPCKHALALLTLWARDDPVIGGDDAGGEGADVARQWAEQRAGRAAAAAATAAEPARPVDEQARARRQADRARLMDAGIDELALWLADLVRGGTAEARRRPYAWWEAAAARLVDAQLPGLAEQVRDTGAGLAGRGDDWAGSLLDDLGRWWTVVQAWRRRDTLAPDPAADLRVEVGWSVPTAEVRGADDVTDRWQVLGAFRTDDGRLQQQRTWLRGLDSGEQLVVLDFAARAQPLPAARLVGTVLHADVARYPGSAPRRALLPDDAVVVGTDARLPGGVDLAIAADALAEAWATNPWARRVPVVLDEVGLSVPDRLVRDAAGLTVRLLLDDDPWALAARTGGRPCRVFGELEADGFRPLTVEAAP